MATQEVKRKLTAILSADVKGYSRLMGADEEGTLHTLTTYRELMTSLIQQHNGRVVNAPGDALLAEFESVVDAVKSAAEIQRELSKQNADLPPDRRMEYRIGINLGDVMVDGDSIYGDGVNIAARLESLAEAGGICISGTAFDHVKNKLNLGYKYLGEQAVRNILEPVRVYQILMEPDAAGKIIGEKRAQPRQWQRVTIGLVVAVIVVVAVIIWKLYTPSAPKPEVASKENMSFPLPDVPSIAVLPFVNMSGDPKQEFLCDGITDEIITALTKIPRLVVIARNSTFTYKGKPVKVKQVSEELGVRYVLEGGLQRSGDRVRINAQLIDALTGHHLWADSYDRDLKDLFALQDEITIGILTATQVKLKTVGQIGGPEKYFKGKHGLNCYLKLMEARNYYTRETIEDNNLARRMIEEAIAMCPENPMGYMYLGWVYLRDLGFGNTKSPRETIEKINELSQKALAMDDSLAPAHALLGSFHLIKRQYDKAIAEGERAVALMPGEPSVLSICANFLNFAGRPEEAIPLLQKAIRLSPFGPAYFYTNFGTSLRMTGRFEEAVSAYNKAIQLAPDFIVAHIGLAGTYSLMDREKEAHAEAAEVLRINPKFSVHQWAKLMPFKDQSETDKMVKAWHKAGLK
jgi:adenylate cyclase